MTLLCPGPMPRWILIAGRFYGLSSHRPEASDVSLVIRLRKDDGETYDISVHTGWLECTCPDHVFRRDGIDPGGCKHIMALRQVVAVRPG